MLAARYGFTGVVRVLVDHGAALNKKDNTGRTALIWAERNGRTAIVNFLKPLFERLKLAQEAAARAREDWVKAGMPMDGVKAAQPLKLKKKVRTPA